MNLETLLPTLTDYGVKIIGALIAFWVTFKIANFISGKLIDVLTARNFDETLTRFFGKMVRWLIIIAAMLAVLSIFGIETTSFAAILGAAGLAVGLAFQGTLGNFSAGVLLLTFRPFKIGDVVTAGGTTGEIKEIGLFVCSFGTADGRHVVVPNSAVAGGSIENLTDLHGGVGARRVDINVGCEYSADIDATRAVLDKAAAAVAGRHDELGHAIVLTGLGGSSVDWQVRVWCDASAYWDVWQETIRQVKTHLDQAGIGIPFPQMDVHLDGQLKS